MFSYLAIRFNGEPTKTRNDLLIERTTSGSLRMEDSGLMTVTMITRSPTTVAFLVNERQLETDGKLAVLLKLGTINIIGISKCVLLAPN